VTRGAYLLAHLMEAGPVMSGGMGPAPLTFAELRAWQDMVGVELQPWEAKLMRKLSVEFASESQQATAHDRPAPWSERAAPDREAIGRQLGRELRAMAMAQRQGRRQ
jgi:hypothetical protein